MTVFVLCISGIGKACWKGEREITEKRVWGWGPRKERANMIRQVWHGCNSGDEDVSVKLMAMSILLKER